MEKNKSQRSLLITHYSLLIFCLIGLLLASGCNSNRSEDKQPNKEQAAVTTMPTDSLPQPTGNAKLDSLLRLTATAKQDTNLAKLYYKIGRMYVFNNPQKATEYLLKMNRLNEQLDWNKGRHVFALAYVAILENHGFLDSALVINRQALELAKKENNAEWIASQTVTGGTIYRNKEWYETAMQYYMEALPYMEQEKDSDGLGYIYTYMSSIYKYLNQTEKAIEYGKKAMAFRYDEHTLVKLAEAYSAAYQYEKAKSYYLEALRICEQQNNINLKGTIYFRLSEDAFMYSDLETVEKYINLMAEVNQKMHSLDCLVLLMRSRLETFKGNFALSEKQAQEALKIAIENNTPEEQKQCYTILSELAIAQHHDFREYMKYWKEMDILDKTIAKERAMRSSEEMKVKYETEKKELRITDLEKEKGLIIWLSIAGGVVLLLALATFILLWRWTLQKRKLAESKNRQLEQEKQLVATQAVLEGETRERSRLARDLHDGLGSMLTGAKLSLLEMKRGAKLEYNDVERFDKALGLLDNSVVEMRRVAHHLMPDSLSRFGLKTALSDFCGNYPIINFNYYGDESRLDPNLEVMIYRSIHELVNNALKYSDATQIMVQIMQEPNRIAFTVQDDGCGFDPSAETQGTGLQNIRNRIASFGGNIQIDSKAGEGTEVNGELKL